METKTLTVHCTYDEQGPDLQDLITESFRTFVKKELRIFEKSTKDVLS